MAATHTVLFTVMPRGISLNGGSLPVSVLVSPRLTGADRLGAFPDWLNWTTTLKDGLTLTFRSGAQTATAKIDTKPLQPDLWRALFTRDTFVRPRAFDDYSQHGIVSYSVRESLSALKAVYQEAAVTLALPDDRILASGRKTRQPSTARRHPRRPGRALERERRQAPARARAQACKAHSTERSLAGPLDAEGLITAARNAGAFQSVAVPFARVPPHADAQAGGRRAGEGRPIAFDFHRALSSLESHPELLRALGLVFDLELPVDVVPHATVAPAAPAVESIASVADCRRSRRRSKPPACTVASPACAFLPRLAHR